MTHPLFDYDLKRAPGKQRSTFSIQVALLAGGFPFPILIANPGWLRCHWQAFIILTPQTHSPLCGNAEARDFE